MAKKSTPKKPKPAANERFGDWTHDNIIPLEPGQVIVNDDPEGDPHKLAMHGEPDLVPRVHPDNKK